MKNLSRILTAILCFTPLVNAMAAPVATTAGSNLTAFNPNNANNNQWSTMVNGRYNGNSGAKVDFGNCNAVILRCAQPKCANGGCADMGIATSIVTGCVQANDSCKQYGDDLVQYMSAQLVASSNAKINEQNAALETARLQAEAQAAAAANAQSQQQIQAMQSQMYEMQQEMARQQEISNQQLQEALAAQQAQSEKALADMRNAATEAAQQNEAGVSAYQQDAIDRGISSDVLERQKIAGQAMTEIENTDVSLKALQTAMQNAFEYAGCDKRGNDCKGPKRIKKWRELASGFIDPYDAAIDHIYDALTIAQMTGIDLNQIYAMLGDACASWSQYLCPAGATGSTVEYGYFKEDEEYVSDAPRVCKLDTGKTNPTEAEWKKCQPCRWVKALTEGEDVYAGWIEASRSADDSQTVISCGASSLDTNKLFTRRTSAKNGTGIVDIDILELWLDQAGPDKKIGSGPIPKAYCSTDFNQDKEKLQKAVLSKSVKTADLYAKLDGSSITADSKVSDGGYINPVYAICDTHQFNAGIDAKTDKESSFTAEEQDKIKEIVALKVTAISQQMYKQYEYLSAALRRIKIQLEKATLTASLEAAGAKSEGSSSGLLGSGSSKASQYRDCRGKNMQGTLDCMRENYSVLSGQVKKCDKEAKKILKTDIGIANDLLSDTRKIKNCSAADTTCIKEPASTSECMDYLGKYSSAMTNLDRDIADDAARRSGSYR